jgi:anti-sigma B factor antagonist
VSSICDSLDRALRKRTRPLRAHITEEPFVDLSITTCERPGGVVVVSPRGELDMENAYELRDAIGAVLANERPELVTVDLAAVTFIDSVGISALVAGHQTAAVSDVPLVVTNPSEFVHKQLYVCGLLGLFGAPRPRRPDEAEWAAPASPAEPAEPAEPTEADPAV